MSTRDGGIDKPASNVWVINPATAQRHNGAALELVDEVAFGMGDEHFWASTERLSNLRRFARARRVGPYSLLGVALVKAVSSVPPYVVLPPARGSYGSLNLYTALVGPSGTSKSTSMAAGREHVVTVPNVPVSQPGSGEGLAKCFAYVSNSGGVRTQEGVACSVIGFVPEIAAMLQAGNRGGATLLADWRSGWSGERLGKDYADNSKRVVIMDHRYRLTYVLGVVPMLAKELFDGAYVGTPQRILWLPTSDPDCPRVAPDPPKRLTISAWPEAVGTTGTVQLVDREVRLPQLLEVPATPKEFEALGLPQAAIDEIDERAYLALNRELSHDSEENHDLFNREKVAAALMRLHNRIGEVTELDWQLSGHLMEMSTTLRAETQRLIASTEHQQQVRAAHVRGKLADIEHNAEGVQALKRVQANLVRYLSNSGGEMPSSDLRSRLNSKDREPYYDTALAHLESGGVIERVPTQYHGSDGCLIRLI